MRNSLSGFAILFLVLLLAWRGARFASPAKR
jgi:hypothetical protein